VEQLFNLFEHLGEIIMENKLVMTGPCLSYYIIIHNDV